MAEWDESKHKRGQPDNAGQFVRQGESQGGRTQSKEYPHLPNGRGIVSRAERVVGDISPISRADYSIIKSEVFRKQSQRGYNKKRDYAYSANDFYIFDNGHEIGSFEIKFRLPIESNEDIIDKAWRWIEKHG